jgi:hypothetical protein
MKPETKDQEIYSKEIQEFLDNGGEIKKIAPGERTENLEFKHSFYGKRNKKAEEGKE